MKKISNESKFILSLVFALGIILLLTTPIAESYIPPTRAFFKILVGNDNVTSDNSTAGVIFIAGSNMSIIANDLANTVTFSANFTGGNSSGIQTINGDSSQSQTIAGTTNQITVSDLGATHTINVGSDIAQTDLSNDFKTNQQQFGNTILIRNPSYTFAYTITGNAITANRTINLPLITGTDTLPALNIINNFTKAQQINPSGTIFNLPSAAVLHIIGDTANVKNGIFIDNYGQNSGINARRAGGTPSAITATPIDTGFQLTMQGYETTNNAFTNGRAAIRLFAGEAFTNTAQGTYISFLTTGIGTTSTTEKLRILDTDDIAIKATGKIFLDGIAGTGDTYLVETSANLMSLTAGGNIGLQISGTSPYMKFQEETTGSGVTVATTANNPAVTPSAIHTWLKVKAPDGDTVYIPAWK